MESNVEMIDTRPVKSNMLKILCIGIHRYKDQFLRFSCSETQNFNSSHKHKKIFFISPPR